MTWKQAKILHYKNWNPFGAFQFLVKTLPQAKRHKPSLLLTTSLATFTFINIDFLSLNNLIFIFFMSCFILIAWCGSFWKSVLCRKISLIFRNSNSENCLRMCRDIDSFYCWPISSPIFPVSPFPFQSSFFSPARLGSLSASSICHWYLFSRIFSAVAGSTSVCNVVNINSKISINSSSNSWSRSRSNINIILRMLYAVLLLLLLLLLVDQKLRNRTLRQPSPSCTPLTIIIITTRPLWPQELIRRISLEAFHRFA